MNTFLTKLILFISPILLVVAFQTYTLASLGEFTSMDDLLKLHTSGQPYLLGKRYVPFRADPKYEIMKTAQPDITTLGNSRVLQVRASFFASTTSFYNYGEVGSVSKLRETLERFRADTIAYPKLIVVALEPSYFIDHRAGVNVSDDGVGTPQWLLIYANLFKDLLKGKINPEMALARKTSGFIGAEANILHSGYREDGSRQYSEMLLDYTYPGHEDYQFEDTRRRIEQGINLFTQATLYDPARVAEYTEFLNLARTLGIHIVAFFPPYAPTVYAMMQEPQYEFSYQKALAKELAMVTSSHGFSFKDFSDPASLSLSDPDFFDGYHPKEHVLGSILTQLSQDGANLHQYLRR